MKTIPALFTLLLLAGCACQTVASYQPEPETIPAVQNAVNTPVNIGQFHDASFRKELTCRSLSIIRAPDNQSYADTIRRALIDELVQAGRYDPDSPVTLTAQLNRIDFETEKGSWIIRMTFLSSNGKQMVLEKTTEYNGIGLGEAACLQAAWQYLPSVKQFMADLLASPEFAGLTQNTPSPASHEETLDTDILNAEQEAAAEALAREAGKERIRRKDSLENIRKTDTGSL
ncbi:MAG: hypothetical protein NC112_08420 [Oxalobacter formigenes]|nr:hypothetical protein [Oxalobacter formigenes]